MRCSLQPPLKSTRAVQTVFPKKGVLFETAVAEIAFLHAGKGQEVPSLMFAETTTTKKTVFASYSKITIVP